MKPRLVLAAIAGAVYSALRGLNEAMVMHKPNVRDHPLFRWYHLTRVLEATAGAITVLLAWGNRRRVVFLSGLAVIGWESFEAAYVLGRLGQANWHENVMGVYAVDGMGMVLTLHVVRTLLGVLLLWRLVCSKH